MDLGTDDSKTSVNYPDYAHKLCKKVSKNSKNIVTCKYAETYILLYFF